MGNELKTYFKIVVKRLWIVLLLPLLAGTAAAYQSYYIAKPVYVASTTLFVINKNVNPQYAIGYDEIMTGQLLVKDYQELVKSLTVTKTVLSELKIKDITPHQLTGMISVSAKNETRLMQISVSDGNPKRAQKLANKIGQVFMKKAVILMKAENVEIIDEAERPVYPVSPQPEKNIAIAVFAGLFAAVGLVFLIEYLDDRIKTGEDIKKHFGLPVLGTIPILKKNKHAKDKYQSANTRIINSRI